jgi:hypothetical protein
MRGGGLWYPCCGCRVRTRPHSSKFKQKLKTIIKKGHNENENKEQHHLLIYRKNDINANSNFLFVN